MKRRYDIVHAIILVLFLVLANFLDNTMIKGVILLLFSAVLIVNTMMKLRIKMNHKFSDKLFYGLLLFLDTALAVGAIYVIISGVLER